MKALEPWQVYELKMIEFKQEQQREQAVREVKLRRSLGLR